MNKEPMFHMSKRETISLGKRIAIYIAAIVLALIVCAAVIVGLVHMNPLGVYKAIFDGALGSNRRIWITIRDTLVLLCIAVGLAPAFKMRFWNIGAEGQVLIGGVVSAACMIYLGADPYFFQGILEYQRDIIYLDDELRSDAGGYFLYLFLGESKGF